MNQKQNKATSAFLRGRPELVAFATSLLLAATFAGDAKADEAHIERGASTHIHDHEDEVFIVLEGEVTFDLAGQRFTRGPMGTAFLPRGTPHTFVIGPNGARCLTVLTPGGFEGFFAEMARGGFQLPQDLAAVTEIAARYESHIVGSDLAQQEVQHA